MPSLNTYSNTVSNPLISNPTAPKPLLPKTGFGQATTGAISTFLNSKPLVTHPSAPTAQPTSHTVTTNPDGSTTTKQTYAPNAQSNNQTNNQSTPAARPAPAAQPTVQIPQPGTPQDYANQVTQASQPNAVGQGAANAAGLFGAMKNIAGLQQYAGGQTQGLDQSFANLSRPQSTGNMAGEQGLFNTQNAIFQNAANTSAQQALAQQQIQQAGATTNLNASLPAQQGLTSTLYNPLAGAGQGGQGLGDRASIAGNVGNLQDLQGKYNNIQATVSGIQGLKGQLSNLLGNVDLNSTPITALNGLLQSIGTNTSSPQYQQLQNLASELSQRYASYLGSGGTVTNDVRDAAAQLVPGKFSPQAMLTVLDGLDQQSNAVLQGYGNQIQYIQNQLNSGQGFSQQNQSNNSSSSSNGSGNSLYIF